MTISSVLRARCGLLASLIALTASAQDAAMFRGTADHTALYASAPVRTKPSVLWRFHTTGRVISSPAVVHGTAYVGSTDNYLYAIETSAGAQRWKFKTASAVTSSPAVVGGVVYFGSYDATFYAVDATTGKERWKFQTAGERRFTGTHLHGSLPAAEAMPDPWDFYLSSPAVSQGTVYFGSGDGNVYALDAASGRLKWRYHTGDVVHASPAVADGVVYVGSWDSYFYALDATSGALRWRLKTGEDSNVHNQVGFQGSAVVSDGMVYVGCRDSHLYAIDARTGQQRWAYNGKGTWISSSPVVKNGKVYVGTGDARSLIALDARTGALISSLGLTSGVFSSAALTGDVLYMGILDGRLIAVDLKTVKPLWVFQTESSRHYTNAKTGRVAFPASSSDTSNGDFYDNMVIAVSSFFQAGSIISSPVVVDGVLYVGSGDGNLYALK